MMQGVSESLGLHGGHHQNPFHHHLLSPPSHSTHVLACAGGERAKKEVDNERHIPEVDVETNQIPLRCWQDPMPPFSVTETPRWCLSDKARRGCSLPRLQPSQTQRLKKNSPPRAPKLYYKISQLVAPRYPKRHSIFGLASFE